MRLSLEELQTLSDEQLLEKYTTAIILQTKDPEKGPDPFDTTKLKDEIFERFKSSERLLRVYSEPSDGGMIGEP